MSLAPPTHGWDIFCLSPRWYSVPWSYPVSPTQIFLGSGQVSRIFSSSFLWLYFIINQLMSYNSISTSPIGKRMKSEAMGLSVYLTNRKKKKKKKTSTSPNTTDTFSSYKFWIKVEVRSRMIECERNLSKINNFNKNKYPNHEALTNQVLRLQQTI